MVGKTRGEIENKPFPVGLEAASGEKLLSQFKEGAASRQIEPRIETHLSSGTAGRAGWI
jgi:hypothetical protein